MKSVISSLFGPSDRVVIVLGYQHSIIKVARLARRDDLPSDVTPFVGREGELSQILTMLSTPACRLLTIVALGGMGKIRLALAAARQANQEQALLFLNGVVFVSLVGVESVNALPLAIADALKVPLSARAPQAELLNFLRNKELLIVLDNVEQLLDGVTWLVTILINLPHVKLLLTSREALNVAAEWHLDLEGLPCPKADSTPLETFSAGQLRAGRADNLGMTRF